ncbi:glycosyltransferase family 39 protein [Nannocystis pusilla]|uniref:glycosyltransferase family 39 protein n=1 Tax=Nannocystis pusilla TaxID=889268 RepID=UPI001CCC190D
MTPGPSRLDRGCDRAAAILLLAVLVVGLATVGDYGATVDEPLRMRSSWLWWDAFAARDLSRVPDDVRAHYGVLFDLLGQLVWHVHRNWFGGVDEFLGRHALCFFTGWLGLLGTYKLTRRLAPQPAPLVALLLLVLAPRWYGASFTQPKDIPFATAWVWTMLAMVRAIERPGARATTRVAAMTALTTAVRPFGALLLPLFAGVLVLVAPGPDRRDRLRWSSGQVALLFGAGGLLTVALWPVLWTRAPWHVVRSIAALSQHAAGSPSLFFGTVYPYDAAPAAYAAVWSTITLPGPTLVGLACGLVFAALAARRSPPRATWLPWALIGLWIAVPLVMPALRRTSLYDTSRQLLFVTPALCVVAGVGLTAAVRRLARRSRRLALAAGLALALSGLEVVARMVHLHPYQQLYFGPLVGGLPGAHGRFDVAYHAETYREALTWLRQNRGKRTHLHLLGNGSNVGSYYCWRLNMQFNTPVFDYYVSEVRQGWEDILPGQVVHTIEREGVPLLVIKKVEPMAELTRAWLQPEAGAEWQAHPAAWGRVPTESLPTSPTGKLAFALDSPRAQRARVYLRIQGRVRVRWQGQPLVDWPYEPFVYRASTTFPSLIPLDLDLPAGRSWLEVDLERVNVAKGVGLYFPAALELTTPTDTPPPSLHIPASSE